MSTIRISNRRTKQRENADGRTGNRPAFRADGLGEGEKHPYRQSYICPPSQQELESFMSDSCSLVSPMTEFTWERNADGIKDEIIKSAIESIDSAYMGMKYVMKSALVQRTGIEPTMYSIATVAADGKDELLCIMDKYVNSNLSMMRAICNMDQKGAGSGSGMVFGVLYDVEKKEIVDGRVFSTGGYALGIKPKRPYLVDFTQPSLYTMKDSRIIGIETLSFLLNDTARADNVIENFLEDAADRPTIITCAETSDKFDGAMAINTVITIDENGYAEAHDYDGELPFDSDPGFIC